MFPGAICRLQDQGTVALTIDDGPSASTTELLDALDAQGLTATFFLSGEAVLKHPSTARAIVTRGHGIASHGFAHEDLAWKDRSQVEADLAKSVAVIEDATGRSPRHYRPPYGRLRPAHRDVPASYACALVLWSSMPGDFHLSVPVDVLLQRIRRVRGGEIVVLHDHAHGARRTTACIEALADLIRRNGLRSVAL